MADTTKLMLSDVELRFVNDTSWVLTKHRIIRTVADLLNEQVPVISKEIKDILHTDLSAIASSAPKITRGENYQLLPYVILDYPAVFDKENVFALRTMFWWGNFVSITLQLKGKYKNLLLHNITRGISRDADDIFICINENEWVHDFSAANYVPAAGMPDAELKKVLQRPGFIKLAIKFDLEKWNGMPALLESGYKKMISLISG